MLSIRRSNERGHAEHGWLDSYHSFSFADYYDASHVHFGSIRVINEDRIKPDTGFGTHAHHDMEIISYVLEGALAHTDSMGNEVIIHPGEVQRMSAGTGVVHSEFNHATEVTHFLQIWILPKTAGLQPSYEQTFFPAIEKRGVLRLVVSPTGADGSVTVHQDAMVYAGLFNGAESTALAIEKGRLVYVQVARGVIHVNGSKLAA